jgi:hypothetical protein
MQKALAADKEHGNWLWWSVATVQQAEEDRDLDTPRIGLIESRKRTEAECERVLNILKHCEEYALRKGRNDTVSPNPRERFFEEILGCWIEAGTRLTPHRHPETHRPRGPVVRYTQAVSGAVMRKDAPSADTIYSLVRRIRKRFLQTGHCDADWRRPTPSHIVEAVARGEIGLDRINGIYDLPIDPAFAELVKQALYGGNLPTR